MQNSKLWLILAGAAAGSVNGLFGGGGGMVLIPLLSLSNISNDRNIFDSSIAIILPICVISLITIAFTQPVPWIESLPWMISGAIGGFLATKWGKKIPVLWLHKGLGILILYGGIRYLC